MPEVNGNHAPPSTPPALVVWWDHEKHVAHLSFDNSQLKSWDAVINTLATALRIAEDSRRVQMMQAIQAQHQAAIEEAAIRRMLKS